MEQSEIERMFVELSELLGAGWRVHIDPALDAAQLMNVPATVKLLRWPDPSDTGKGLQPVPALAFNRYQIATELPRAIHVFHVAVFGKPTD